MKSLIAAAMLAVALVSAGCASNLGGEDFSRNDTRRAYEVQMGTIESVRHVQIEGTQSGVGTAAGAVVGGVAGSTIGEGKGSILAAVVGAVAGGVAGKAIEEHTTKKPGLELTVRLDTGRTIAVVQQDTGEIFNLGDRVRVLGGGGETRVSH